MEDFNFTTSCGLLHIEHCNSFVSRRTVIYRVVFGKMEVFDNSISLVKDIQSGSLGLLTKENLLKSLKVEQFVD